MCNCVLNLVFIEVKIRFFIQENLFLFVLYSKNHIWFWFENIHLRKTINHRFLGFKERFYWNTCKIIF